MLSGNSHSKRKQTQNISGKDAAKHTLDFNYAQAYKLGTVGDIKQGV